jgi:two-component system NtrC family sensor kinase
VKLVRKFTLALVAGTTAILAVNGYFRVKREVLLFESDRVRDHRLIGRALGAAVSAAWQSDGPARALAVIEQANAQEGKVHIRWTPLDTTEGARVDRAALAALGPGDALTLTLPDSRGEDNRYTYIPVVVGGARKGALEVSESLASERAYIRTTLIDTALTTLLLAAVCAGLCAGLGAWLVGRPIRAVADKARRVGEGDFSNPLQVTRQDEIADLANEMNAMCDRLVEAHARVAAEVQARIAALEQLRHADRLATVGKLASGIAHELGTPLNVIGARAGMIAGRETNADETLDYARVIVDSCDRMTRIIRQLLEFARRKGAQTAPRDLADLAVQTVELLRPLAAKKAVELVVQAPSEPALVNADGAQIQQVITNLVVNAVQATPGPGKVEVVVASERMSPPGGEGGVPAEYRALRVRDGGGGITPSDLPHVFEPFFTTKDVGEGTGLGLAVAHGIVSDHGGWIAVKSEVGKGSEFSIYLPKVEAP